PVCPAETPHSSTFTGRQLRNPGLRGVAQRLNGLVGRVLRNPHRLLVGVVVHSDGAVDGILARLAELLATNAAAAAAATYSRHGQCGRPRLAPSVQRAHRPSAPGTCSRSNRCQTSGSPSARTRATALNTGQAHRRSELLPRTA